MKGGQAMLFLQFLALDGTPYSEDFWGTLPISKAEVFAAVSPYLRDPESKPGRSALSICLRHDIMATRALTQPLLTHRSGERRLRAIRDYLRQGRDESALHALEELFEAAPLNPDSKNPRWFDLKGSWSHLLPEVTRASSHGSSFDGNAGRSRGARRP